MNGYFPRFEFLYKTKRRLIERASDLQISYKEKLNWKGCFHFFLNSIAIYFYGMSKKRFYPVFLAAISETPIKIKLIRDQFDYDAVLFQV